jgi:hypothetical protein
MSAQSALLSQSLRQYERLPFGAGVGSVLGERAGAQMAPSTQSPVSVGPPEHVEPIAPELQPASAPIAAREIQSTRILTSGRPRT